MKALQLTSDLIHLASEVGLELVPIYTGPLPVMLKNMIWVIKKNGEVVLTSDDVVPVIDILQFMHAEHYGLN